MLPTRTEPAETESKLSPKFNPAWSYKSETIVAEETWFSYLTKAETH